MNFSARWHFTSVKWKSEYDLFWRETIFFIITGQQLLKIHQILGVNAGEQTHRCASIVGSSVYLQESRPQFCHTARVFQFPSRPPQPFSRGSDHFPSLVMKKSPAWGKTHRWMLRLKDLQKENTKKIFWFQSEPNEKTEQWLPEKFYHLIGVNK